MFFALCHNLPQNSTQALFLIEMKLFFFFSVELLTLPTVGTRNLVKHLNQDEEQSKYFQQNEFYCFFFIWWLLKEPFVLGDVRALMLALRGFYGLPGCPLARW